MIPHVTHYTKPSVCNMELKHMSPSLKKNTQPWPQQYTPTPAQDYSAVGREEPRTPHTQTKKGRKLSLQNGTSKPMEQASPKHCLPIPTPFPTYLIYTCLHLAVLADTKSCLGLNAILNLSVRIYLPDRLRCSPLSNLAKRCPIGRPFQGPLLNMTDE